MKDVYLLKGIVLHVPTLIINLICSGLCRQGLKTEHIRLYRLTLVMRNLKPNVHIETNHAASRVEVHTQILISKVCLRFQSEIFKLLLNMIICIPKKSNCVYNQVAKSGWVIGWIRKEVWNTVFKHCYLRGITLAKLIFCTHLSFWKNIVNTAAG